MQRRMDDWLIGLGGSLGGSLFGYDTGVISGAMVQMVSYLHLNHREQETVVSITVLCAFLASPAGAWSADKFGRKRTLIFTSLLFIATSLSLALSTNWIELFVSRAFIGVAVGMVASVTPVYLAECIRAESRGAILSAYNLFINGGQLVAALICGVLSGTDESVGWRWMLGLATIPAITQLIALVTYLPESPLWIAQNQEKEEDQRRRRQSAGSIILVGSLAHSDAETEEEQPVMKPVLSVDERPNSSTRSIPSIPSPSGSANASASGSFSSLPSLTGTLPTHPPTPSYTLPRALFIGCFLQFVQQACGINTVMYYTGAMLVKIGFSGKQAMILNAVIASFNFGFGFLGVFLMNRYSRRSVTLGSLLGVSLSLGLMILSFMLKRNVMTVVCLCIYLASFGSGMGPAPWVINAEIYPLEYRHYAGISTAVNWVTNYIISATFLTLLDVIGEVWTFCMYFAVSVVGVWVLWEWLPETRDVRIRGSRGGIGNGSSDLLISMH